LPDFRTRPSGEEGFTLVELSVAMVIAVIIMVAASTSLRGALSGSRMNRFRQEATAVAMATFEHARSLEWEQLAMSDLDPQDPWITDGVLPASASGLNEDEQVLECPTGVLAPVTTETIGQIPFTSRTYVTHVSETLRRVYVWVEWEIEGNPYQYRSDSLVSIVSARGADVIAQPMFPEAAILATGNVALYPGSTSSNPPTAHTASIWLNASFSNLDAVVDGDIVAGGTVTANPLNIYGSIEQNAGSPVNVPDQPTLAAWQTGLVTEAQTGSALIGNQLFSNTTITAPMHVTGSVTFAGNVVVNGSGPLYATGSIVLDNGAAVTSAAAFLVAEGVVDFRSGSQLDVGELGTAGVVSLSSSNTAVTLTGGAPGTIQGVAYAPYGGIRLTGSLPWHGALVATGDGSGDIDMGGGAWLEYPANLVPTTTLFSGLRPTFPESLCG
jgi:prepilin-type N-terminal cleavage/methylation domain-containing protein